MLYTWNPYNMVCQLYFNKKLNKPLGLKVEPMGADHIPLTDKVMNSDYSPSYSAPSLIIGGI